MAIDPTKALVALTLPISDWQIIVDLLDAERRYTMPNTSPIWRLHAQIQEGVAREMLARLAKFSSQSAPATEGGSDGNE